MHAVLRQTILRHKYWQLMPSVCEQIMNLNTRHIQPINQLQQAGSGRLELWVWVMAFFAPRLPSKRYIGAATLPLYDHELQVRATSCTAIYVGYYTTSRAGDMYAFCK